MDPRTAPLYKETASRCAGSGPMSPARMWRQLTWSLQFALLCFLLFLGRREKSFPLTGELFVREGLALGISSGLNESISHNSAVPGFQYSVNAGRCFSVIRCGAQRLKSVYFLAQERAKW
ncbi:hypothetical protein MUG91_G62n46 [Manis pentadactyla]|nr:hypothetical protein MUG91_G62n46 [Manis pentadactyla]